MASKRPLQDKDIQQELILNVDSDACTYAYSPPPSDNDHEGDERTEKG
jgi:hypothetical protein